MRYLVIIEKGPDGYGAYVPDLPGCIAASETRDAVLRQIRLAMEARIQSLRNANRPIPKPVSTVEVVEIRMPTD